MAKAFTSTNEGKAKAGSHRGRPAGDILGAVVETDAHFACFCVARQIEKQTRSPQRAKPKAEVVANILASIRERWA